MRYFIVLFFFSLSLFAKDENQINININENKIYISGVICNIQEYTDMYEVKNKCLTDAKDIAFLQAIKLLNEDIPCSQKNIDKTLISFEVARETFSNNNYNVSYNFTFDKKSIEDLKAKLNTKMDFTGKEALSLRVYSSNSYLVNSIFMKIYKNHQNVKYKSVSGDFLELEVQNISVQNFKHFLEKNFIKFNSFGFPFAGQTQENLIEIF